VSTKGFFKAAREDAKARVTRFAPQTWLAGGIRLAVGPAGGAWRRNQPPRF
jgi:hypothetical protein